MRARLKSLQPKQQLPEAVMFKTRQNSIVGRMKDGDFIVISKMQKCEVWPKEDTGKARIVTGIKRVSHL